MDSKSGRAIAGRMIREIVVDEAGNEVEMNLGGMVSAELNDAAPIELRRAPQLRSPLLLGALASVGAESAASQHHMSGPTDHEACRKKRKSKSKRKQTRKSRQKNKKR